MPPTRATDAVLRGAYDVVALSDRDAAGTIVTRLEEMLAAEASVPAADHIVQKSAASFGGGRRSVFLDEIDDTPLETQVKLLRVLEDHVVSRLGENQWRKVDFRIIAATNRDLEPLVASGRFGATSTSGSPSFGSISRRCASGSRTCRR